MLSSVELEILDAQKYKYIRNLASLCSAKPRMLFFMLINVKMPTSVGILTVDSYEQEKIHAQLS